MEPTNKVCLVWNNDQSRKIFVNIVYGTQLRKCKQLRTPFYRCIDKLVKLQRSDDEIYDEVRNFIQNQPPHIKNYIQHQGHYRGVNRTTKIYDFIRLYAPNLEVRSVLDVGCGDGSITNVVSEKLGLQKDAVHGCDILPNNVAPPNFSFSLVDETTKKLPYENESFDVVYALMSLHHVKHLEEMLSEIRRVLKKGGLFIVREHDCRTVDMSLVLDIVHGFYSMVWSNPREFEDHFSDHYFAQYFSAGDWEQIISSKSFVKLFSTEREEAYPMYYKGKIINPLRHYWSIYS